MTVNVYFRPMIPLVLSMMSGIGFGTWFPDQNVLAVGVACICSAMVLWGLKQKKTMLIPPMVLFVALGYLSIQSWVAPDLPSHHIIHYADNQAREIIGFVETSPIEGDQRKKFILRATSIRKDSEFISASGKIRVTVVGKPARFDKGDKVSFISRIRTITNFNNPDGFDYKRYMLFRRVMVTAYVSCNHFSVVNRDAEVNRIGMIEGARRKMNTFIENTLQQGEPQDVLKALIIGDRNPISKNLRQSFNRAGVAHLLAISGLHVGIVAAASFIFFQKLLSHIKIFLWNAWVKKGAVILSFIPIWFYGLLSGMSPSTQRAVIMVTVFLLAFLFESEQDPINTLAFAAMLILVINPPSLFSISFQLSFAAVFAILYGITRISYPWESGLGKTKQTTGFFISQKLFYFFLASLLATIGTLPLLMFYFNQISLVGLLTNVIIVPLIGFIVVPLGLLAVFLFPLTVIGASFCLNICSIVLESTLNMVIYVGALPYAAVKTVTPTVLEICCFYVLLWLVLNLKHPRYPIFLAVALSILVLSADTCYWLYQRRWYNDLRVSIIDVGHGSAALLELPKGYTILVDGGGFTANSIFDVGARIVAPFLWRKKIKTIDTVILSHPNSDHVNGLIYIVENFHVKNVWTNNQGSENIGYKNFLRAIEKNSIHMPTYKDIFGHHWINGVCLEIIYPPVDFIARQQHDRWRDLNNNSLVVKVSLGSTSMLFPGDIKARAEAAIVASAGGRIASTILIAPHHGSRTSSSSLFIEKVNPNAVVISSGRKGWFELPHPSVVKRYRQKGCRVYATSHHGAIVVTTDGRTLNVKTTVADADCRHVL